MSQMTLKDSTFRRIAALMHESVGMAFALWLPMTTSRHLPRTRMMPS